MQPQKGLWLLLGLKSGLLLVGRMCKHLQYGATEEGLLTTEIKKNKKLKSRKLLMTCLSIFKHPACWWLSERFLTGMTWVNFLLSFCLHLLCSSTAVQCLDNNCDQIKSKPSRGHIPLLSLLLAILSAVKLQSPCLPHLPISSGREKAREVTHPEVSDDKGQHVAPLPIVLSSCQAPARRHQG